MPHWNRRSGSAVECILFSPYSSSFCFWAIFFGFYFFISIFPACEVSHVERSSRGGHSPSARSCQQNQGINCTTNSSIQLPASVPPQAQSSLCSQPPTTTQFLSTYLSWIERASCCCPCCICSQVECAFSMGYIFMAWLGNMAVPSLGSRCINLSLVDWYLYFI